MRHRLNNRSVLPPAITLIELMVVISIIAVLAGGAMIAFRGSANNAYLQNAADQLMTDLRLTRDQARMDQQPYTLTINSAQCQYQAVGVLSVTGKNDISVNLAPPPYAVRQIQCTLGGDEYVAFDAKGNASPNGTITLLGDRGRIAITITEGGEVDQVAE